MRIRRKWLSLALLGSMLLGVLQPALAQASPGFDYTKVPKLLITELVPDTKNVNSADGYESIEIYNNTNRDINFRDYKIVYNNGSNNDWSLTDKKVPVIIKPHQTIVLWIMNGSNTNETADAFNSNYTINGHTSNLIENTNLFRIDAGGGMANTGERSVAIHTLGGVEIAKAAYSVTKSKENYGIHYNYPIDASKNMAMIGAAESQPASPGTVEANQVPAFPSDIGEPPAATTLNFDHVPASKTLVNQDVPIDASITGNQTSVTASVYYKTDVQTAYTPLVMASADGVKHTATIPGQAVVDGNLLQYYIEAADGNQPPERSGTYAVEIESLPPVQGDKLQIEHTSAKQVEAKDLLITAKLNHPDKVKVDKVELLYKSPSQAKYTLLTMKQLQPDGNDYSVTIPANAFVESTLDYTIRVKDVEKSYSVDVNIPPFNAAKVPSLLVTKIVPNTTNVPNTSSDAFEMIEVYNNTDAPIDFKNYKVNYRYPDDGPEADLKWPTTKEDFMIPSQQSVVFWIKNGANNSYTAADFNNFHKTNLVEDANLFVIMSDGMANSGRRGIVIKTNTGKEISYANYDATTVYEGGVSDETKEDKAILFKYPMDGSITMIKTSSGLAAPAPGVIDPALVPAVPVHVEQDTTPPKAEDRSGITSVEQSQNLDLKAFADDERQVATVKVYIRTDKEADYTGYALTQNFTDSLYHYLVPAATLIGSKYIEYYFMVSDGTNEVETVKAKVDITGKPGHDPLRLNVKNGDIVNGTKTLKGTSETTPANTLKLSVDGQAITQGSFDALEHDAYFVFEAKNVDYYFKNAVTMGPESEKDKTILYTFMDPIPTYTTLTFKIDASRFHIGADNVIYIRAGSKTSPFDDRKEENKDDFEVRNVRLMLADGTEIWDPLYVKGKEIKIGDSPGKMEGIGFNFNLDAKYFQSRAYAWDTTKVADGAHQVKVTDSNNVDVTANVTVDNTPPSIKPNVEEGKQYRGSFNLDAEIKDQIAGVDQVIVKLDNQDIKLPYVLSSGSMKAGKHTLTITASDKVGNQAERTVTFTTPEENPLKPELIAPTQGQSELGGSVGLKVKVQDPTNDPMNVTFYRGFQYDGNRTAEGFTGFMNASDTEPPKVMIPEGEQTLTAEDYRKISAEDGDYLVNDAVEQFPYQRYQIKLDPAVQKTDRVDIVWKGKSIEGRKVSLYAWNESAKKWVQLVTRIAGTEDFELKSTVKVEDYAMGQTIQIIVQDEIAEMKELKSDTAQDTYDFSFVWMSDTQYYSQSYPQIYKKIVNWVKDNKESNNIKYVIHTGDIVDKSYQEYQWQEADEDMKVLEDANIPYGVLAGNHDVGHQDNDYTKYWQYFGEQRFKDMPTYGESYQNNRGHYDLVSAGGNDFIIVYMGWGLGDKEIDWMNEVVAKYPERKAILCLHEYMLVSNNRAPIADKIFEKVIKPNKNVIAALSGHYHDAQLKIDELEDDNGEKRKVYQMLADYQGAPEGGLGYIRLMQFDMKNNKLHIKTYSPYLDDYNYYDPEFYPGKDEFSLDLDLQPKTKRVATDYIGVKVYSELPIGKVNNVKSGQQAAFTWNGLKGDSYYQWYTKAEDGNSGQVLSDIWGFYTGKVSNPDPGPGTTKPDPKPEQKPGTKPQPKPETSSDKGVISIKAGADGAYAVDRAALEKAVNEAEHGKVEIKLEAVASEQAAQLALDAAGVQKAKERKLSIEIVGSGFTVMIPAASLPNDIADADRIVLHIDPTMNSSIQTAVNAAISSNGELKSTGVVFTIKLVTFKGKTETAVQQFSGSITVKRTLTAEQQKQLQKEYANMYRLVGGKAEMIAGTFDGSTISFTTDQLGQFAVLEVHKQFADLIGGWADEYILKLAAKNIIRGMENNQFRPNLHVSRADFATLVIRALGIQAAEGQTPFADVAADRYYAGYVSKAAELGLVQGSNGKFRPTEPITRQEAAVILNKMAEYMKKPISGSSSVPAFADLGSISGWAKDAVTMLQAAGIINGKDNNRFDPRGSVTRAEISKMLYIMLNK
ncbi:S-layer homology domain-containing protein [Paenibacillus sp. chi10]|uniref:S-layer homology domain-containing protein n=1 Tax=Paenibacillus suaedae TaxID=3077233 RepID=A0AAJ2JV90_9BACL|nr:S-layer homology domain-containing protein [Paenibacillus sp. chi10]MDT8974902.1 S-layer homology domain-containing protein [Paenibacillus sp. chi10]